MVRNRAKEAAVAFAIGGIVGYLALRLNELGWWFGAAVLAIMSIYYVVRKRQADTGWLLIGAGVIPGLFLLRNAVLAIIDPAVETSFDTWIMLAIAAILAMAGALTVYAFQGHRTTRLQ
jgi:4-hydroxybenzoate polyprenyltransferase